MKLVRIDPSGSLKPTMVGQHFHRHGIVGRSRAIADVIRRIEQVSATRSTVLITGETGTGKELVARAVHNRSAQRDMPFIKVNCAAIIECETICRALEVSSSVKQQAARLMGISPRALSHYLAKYPFIDLNKGQGAPLSRVPEGLRKRHRARAHGKDDISPLRA